MRQHERHEHWDKVMTMTAGVPRHMQTPEDLAWLVGLAQGGNEDARADLWWRMSPLVYNLAIKYGHGGGSEDGHGRYSREQREEIRQEAWVGLADAIDRYDPAVVGKDGLPKGVWQVAGYRITVAIKNWQAKNSGAVGMPTKAWEDGWRIQNKLEAAGVDDWQAMTDTELKAITGVHSTGHILRARQGKKGHLYDEEIVTADRGTLVGATGSAESAWEQSTAFEQWEDLLEWLRGLEAIPGEHWEEATYWKLEQMGLAGDVDAQQLIGARDTILADDVRTFEKTKRRRTQ